MLQRNAFTLLELVVSLASSIVLVAGLAGSLYISNQALSGSANARKSLAASTVLRDLMADVSEAKAILVRTSREVKFTVPDRNGDLVPDVIRYAWSGVAGDPLTYQYNGGTVVNFATDVRAFNLTAITRELRPPSPQVAQGVTFHGPATEAPVSTASTLMDIPVPTETTEGNLLIACVVTDKAATLTAPSGWILVHKGGNNVLIPSLSEVTFGVWRKPASSSEPLNYRFTWGGTRRAYGWMMRFTGHNPDYPIDDWEPAAGSTLLGPHTPPSPAVFTTVPNAMILRLGGFDANRITVGSPGLTSPAQHTAITMNYSNNSSLGCSGGAGYYVPQATAGSSGASNFALTGGPEEYVTVTIAIAPETAE